MFRRPAVGAGELVMVMGKAVVIPRPQAVGVGLGPQVIEEAGHDLTVVDDHLAGRVAGHQGGDLVGEFGPAVEPGQRVAGGRRADRRIGDKAKP